MNPYLKRLRDQYDSLRTSIEGLQTRAATDNRDLTAEELRSVTEQAETAKTLHTQITLLTEQETRSASVADMAAQVADATRSGDQGDEKTVTRVGGATTQDRDPGHYRSAKEGGTFSFFADRHAAKISGDEAAQRRLVEHARAGVGLKTSTEGPGVIAPVWLSNEFETIARQGRPLANAVRQIPLNSPAPLSLPKQTGGTDTEVTDQPTGENTAPENDDVWDSAVDTITPVTVTGQQIVSRQLLDAATPAIDQLIYADMVEAYALKVEGKVGTAISAVGSALAANTTNFESIAQDAAIEVRTNRKLPPNIYAMTMYRYGQFLKLRDGDGRPLLPAETAGPMNVLGVGTVQTDGRLHGLGIIATEGMPSDSSFCAVRSSDVILFESPVLRFRDDYSAGPQSVKLSVWGYVVVSVRRGTTAVKKVTVS